MTGAGSQDRVRGDGAAATASRQIPRLLRAGLLAGGSVALIFAGYEAVERTLLAGASMETKHALHVVRGIASSVCAAGVMAWELLQASPRLLDERNSSPPDPLDGGDRVRRYGAWFVQMRWIAVAVVAMLVVVVVQVAHLLPHRVWWPLVGCTGLLIASNLAYPRLARRRGWASGLLQLQVHADLVILTLLVHFSGGLENQLALLAIIHVVIAGILLPRRQCYWVAVVATLLYAGMGWGEWLHLVDHYTLGLFPHGAHGGKHASLDALFVLSRTTLQGGILLLIAYFVTSLAERTRSHERDLQALADELKAEHRLLERALDTTGTGLRVLGAGGEPRWTNGRWLEWFGAPGANGHAISSTGGEDADEGPWGVTELVLPAGSGGDRPERVLQITKAPIMDEQDVISQVAELAQDVTDQKKAQARMMRAGRMAAVGELAGHVAHEVNNPIAIISAKARLLLAGQHGAMPGKVRGELEKIVHCSDRVATIAQGLLSYCRPSPALRRQLDVRRPLRHAVGMIEQRAQTSGVDILEQLDADIPQVMANAGELEQVFLNLLLNAVDAMPAGGSLRLSARATEGQGQVQVEVEDSGEGMDEAMQQRIWEPFFSTKEEGKGTGLGLAICDGLVRGHGGHIELDSTPGRGSRFTVTLPVAGPPGDEEEGACRPREC